MKIKRVLLVTVAFLLIILISAALFWQSIMVYIAPKAVLTAALTDTVSQLKQRFSGGPMPILMQGLDPEGKNTVALQLEKKNALLGSRIHGGFSP